jgi:enoyl-CoA hydratase/carnithine racemase
MAFRGRHRRILDGAIIHKESSVTQHVLVEKSDKVLALTLNRPDKKNALTRAMYATLGAEIANADADPNIRCILIQANGDMFTAGNDLADFAAIGNQTAAPRPEDANPLLPALARSRTPIVAAVNGRALGIGVTLLLHCDMVYLADDALLIAPFVNLALVPEAGSSLLMPLRIGHVRAFEMFVLGEPVSAEKAVSWGLANRTVPPGELHAAARAAALAIADRAPASVVATKSLMRDRSLMLARMSEETGHFLRQLKSAEFKEAFNAFSERRAPDFSKFD